jgi:hypothetical protein
MNSVFILGLGLLAIIVVVLCVVARKTLNPPDQSLKLSAAIFEVGSDGVERLVEWVPVEEA